MTGRPSVFGALGARRDETSGRTRALIVEALLLTAVLAFSLAVLMSAFSRAALLSASASDLTRASAVAQSVAERFAADPASVAETAWEQDGLLVTCATEATEQDAGTFWTAAISVSDGGAEPLVTLSTARFVKAADGAGTGGAS